jgi:hypothetical protein
VKFSAVKEKKIHWNITTYRYIQVKEIMWRHKNLILFTDVFHCDKTICLWLYSPCGPRPLFHSVGLLGRGISSSQGRYCSQRTAQTQNKCPLISIPQVGFESMILLFERNKTVHALYPAATAIVYDKTNRPKYEVGCFTSLNDWCCLATVIGFLQR